MRVVGVVDAARMAPSSGAIVLLVLIFLKSAQAYVAYYSPRGQADGNWCANNGYRAPATQAECFAVVEQLGEYHAQLGGNQFGVNSQANGLANSNWWPHGCVLLAQGNSEFAGNNIFIVGGVWNQATDYSYTNVASDQAIQVCTLTPATPDSMCNAGYTGFMFKSTAKQKCLGSGATNGQAR